MSWPVSKDYGVQLTSGVEGSVIFQHSKEGLALSFANDRERSVQLHRASTEAKIVIPRQLRLNEKVAASSTDDLLKSSYLPEDLVLDLDSESKKYLSSSVYDPTIKNLMVIGEWPDNKGRSQHVVAVSGGSYGSVLTVLRVADSEASEVSGLSLDSATKIQLDYSIRQIKLSGSKSGFKLMLVRTEHTLHLFQATFTENHLVEVILMGTVESDFTILDMNFNFWNVLQFFTLHSNGEIACHQISSSGTIHTSFTKRVDNPGELSHFRIVEAGFDSNSILLMTRSSVQKIDTETGDCKIVLSLKAFSVLQDFIRVSATHSFVLTSKEIILVQLTKDGMNRLISYKHFLDPGDRSLRMSVTDLTMMNSEIPLYLCTVFSKTNSMLYMLQFGLRDGFFKVLGDPQIMMMDKANVYQELSLLALPVSQAVSSQLSDFNLSTRAASSSELKQIEVNFLLLYLSPDLKLSVDQLKSGQAVDLASVNTETASPLFPTFEELPSRYQEVLQIVGKDLEDTSVDLQEIATSLSTALTNYKESKAFSPGNLWLAVDLLLKVEDLDELESMVAQLIEHFTTEGLVFRRFNTTITREYFNQQNPLKSTFTWLKAEYTDDEILLKKLAIQMVMSLITYSKQDFTSELDKSCEDLITGLSKEFQDIVSEWQDSVPEERPGPSVFVTPSQVNLPFIHLTQPASAIASSSQQSLVSQSSQDSQVTPLTQIERGVFGGRAASKKKKKKRMGGFA